jgi:ribosomal protein L11 methyltransferase
VQFRMEWQQFVMNLEALPPGGVEEVFARHGACAITFSDAGDDPILEPAPGETPLWTSVRITGLFGASADLDRLREDLLRSFRLTRLPEHRVETLEDRVWEREWLKDFRPMRFGRRLWVCPGGFQVDAEDAVIVHLDPGLAFGTGTHPTTALCLEWLESLDLTNKRVLDFGCGSGILSIASLKLGASSVTAVDIDPQAIIASRQNARRNDVDEHLETALDADNLGAEYDVAVANILAAPLIRHAGTICEHLVHGGTIALSGITDQQTAMVADAYRNLIDFDPPMVRAQWARLTGRRN